MPRSPHPQPHPQPHLQSKPQANPPLQSQAQTKAKPAPKIEDRTDEVFLTPRVLDQGAFDSMSGELKDLIRDADGQGKTLKKTSDDVRGLAGALRTAIQELQTRIDRAGAVSPALEGWIKQAHEITTKAIDVNRVGREVERAVTAIVESRKAEFEHSIAPTVETLRQLRKEIERIRASVESATDAAAIRAKADREIGAAVQSATGDLSIRIAEMVRGAFEQERERVTAEIDARVQVAIHARDAVGAAIEAAKKDLSAHAARLNAAIDARLGETASIGAEIRKHADRATEAFSQRVAEVTSSLESRITWSASVQNSIMNRAENSSNQVAAGVARLEAANASVDAAALSLRERMADLERASGERFATAEDRLTAIERRSLAIHARTNSVLAQAEEARRRAEEDAASIERRFAETSELAKALREGPMLQLARDLTEYEAAAGRLSALPGSIARGDRLVSEARTLREQVENLLSQLNITRSLLAEEILGAASRVDEIAASAERVKAGADFPDLTAAKNEHDTLVSAVTRTLDGSRRVEEITRIRLAELREVESLLSSLGSRVALLRAECRSLSETEIKPRRPRDAA